MRLSGAKALVKSLEAVGVEVIFGIPGGAILPTYDALYDSKIRHILVRHEQCAAHAADGYARASGGVGVCMATSGPGATNLVTGITTAYMDSSPVVAITGQVSRGMIGKDAFQEADIIGITTPITKYTFQIRDPREVPKTVKQAFYIASTGRPGPVLIDFPVDVQREEADIDFDEEFELLSLRPTVDPHPLQVKKAAELLLNAERPVILAGGGVIISGASEELVRLAEYLSAPVAFTLMGKGAMPEDHPLCLGMVGMHGSAVANKIIIEADVLLAVGTRFSDRSTGKFEEFCKDAVRIHIDIDAAEIGKNVKPHVPIVADAKKALSAIYEAIEKISPKMDRSTWVQRVKWMRERLATIPISSSGSIRPKEVIEEIRRQLPQDSIITTGVGRNQMWAAMYFKAYRPRTFITSGGLGAMGFGFPAALGAKVAKPDKIVVDIDGDGSFLMTERDLATSIVENIPVIVVILNDGWLGMVKYWQDLFYRKRYCATCLKRGCPDFVKLAEAYGANGFRAHTLDEFSKAFSEALKSDVTTVIDVWISPDEPVLPFVPPGRPLNDIILGGEGGGEG
ncbi:MAG: biosynthetic-type acetolactate synthase large subunit [Nitrososphaeria archaeon]|nr:biosynthetic-type acetolactate synthase large subunit [Nitrososphaeria archaeon]MDW8021407.1 biosynthetic-type acetolactate synthase large subunit [Nitrososphaerota archaeon]